MTGRTIPPDVTAIADAMPREFEHVLVWLDDPAVAIRSFPAVGWWASTPSGPQWWSGLPGDYTDLRSMRWTVTHWKSIEPVNV